MRYLAVIFILFAVVLGASAQPPAATPKRAPKPAKTATPKPPTEAEEFSQAIAVADAAERVAALLAFLTKYPESTEKQRTLGLIVGGRAEIADKKLAAGETAAGIDLFKLAVAEAPTPFPAELFAKVILGFPISLYSREQRAAAFDVAKLIEEKTGGSPSQLLDLARFFISVQYGTEAIRLAETATTADPSNAAGFQVLAVAYRLNFRLDDAANAYAKASELDPTTISTRMSLAEMKRAVGKSDEAAALYRTILEKEPDNASARAGLALTLVEAEKPGDAEAQLTSALAADPENPSLVTGAAYFYARRGQNEKALDLAKKAVALDPSSVFGYVAQARALTAQRKPLEAERVLLTAKRMIDLPTLDYELATSRLNAGLYREAAEILKRNFSINKEGAIETYLGNRILADAGSFTELLSLERRVAIYQKAAADDDDSAARLKALLLFVQKLESADASLDETVAAAEAFARGSDKMRTHRLVFAAGRLLQKKDAAPKVLELTQAAVGGVDEALEAPAPSAAVMADELYDSRQYAIGQNLQISYADIPRPTLLAILRGRLEDIAGQAYMAENNFPQAIVRLRRALSVLPDKSAFSRASWRRLGTILQADGTKDKEALDALIKGYSKDFPDFAQRDVIEALYLKVNGKTDGLDELVGAKPATEVAKTEPTPEPSPAVPTSPEPTPTPAPSVPLNLPEDVPTIVPKTEPTPTPTPEKSPTPEATPTETPTLILAPTPEASPTPTETEPRLDTTNSPAELTLIVPKNGQYPPSPKVDKKPAEATDTPAAKPKDIFEPVVIQVGDTNPPGKLTEKAPEKPAEKTTETPTVPTPVDEKILSGDVRPRVIVTDTLTGKTTTDETATCRININPDGLSLNSLGGPISISAGFETDGDFREITATSVSARDVEIVPDPELGTTRGRAFFIIRSISDATGNFTIVFEAPCGRKEIVVRVK